MEKLRASDDTRVTYDAANGAVRSFFGVDLVEPPAADVARAARSAGDTTQGRISTSVADSSTPTPS